jgi:glycosyltransferase involved in cell wall biosynthesis
MIFPKSLVFTGKWPGFVPGFQNSFRIRIVGKTRFFKIKISKNRYERMIIIPPLSIIRTLKKFGPDVIFTSGFNLWSIISIFCKIFRTWKVVIVYDGSSPSVDMKDSSFRLILRKLIVRFSNALITNTFEGRKYLLQYLQAKDWKVFVKPYEVPESKFLDIENPPFLFSLSNLKHPIFLYVGRVRKRKGIFLLFEACINLKKKGYEEYSLIVVGDGPERRELEYVAKKKCIDKNINFTGWVNYTQLGYYYKNSDVFVIPSFEDVWGMVVLEAMDFGLPVLCSKGVGAKEMIINGSNGYIFDPLNPKELTNLMIQFIVNPLDIKKMGKKSKKIISLYTPKLAAKNLEKIVEFVISEKVSPNKKTMGYRPN